MSIIVYVPLVLWNLGYIWIEDKRWWVFGWVRGTQVADDAAAAEENEKAMEEREDGSMVLAKKLPKVRERPGASSLALLA